MTEEYGTYLVRKLFQPEGAYKAALSPLSRPDAYETLVEEPGLVVEERRLTPAEVEELRGPARPHIAAVEPNHTARLPEPIYREESARRVEPAEARAFHGIDRAHARGVRGKGQRIAIIDTGASEALARKLGRRLVAKESYVPGEDWRDTERLHGSWCLSTIAAATPEAEYVVLKGLSTRTGSGSYDGIIRCVRRARELRCTGISMSLGGPASQTMDDTVNAADAAGLLVVVSGGNDQRDSKEYKADRQSPARARGVLCVAAVGSDLVVADFSNWGTAVDLSALGVFVRAEDVAGFWSGTSMSAPFVAACGVLLMGAGLTKSEAKQALVSSARNTSEPAYQEGSGTIDVAAALAAATPAPPGGSPFDPSLPRVGLSTLNRDRAPEWFAKPIVVYTQDDASSPKVERFQTIPAVR